MPETSIWATDPSSHGRIQRFVTSRRQQLNPPAVSAGGFRRGCRTCRSVGKKPATPAGASGKNLQKLRERPGQPAAAAVRNFFRSGPDVVAPSPPSSTKTATARSPWVAMIQAWVLGGFSLPNSAVPVFAPTGPPGTSARKPACPDVTTARIRFASDAASSLVTGFSAAGAGASAETVDAGAVPSADGAPSAVVAGAVPEAASGLRTSTGDTGAPFATDPAMTAAASGDIRTLPWPIIAAACSVPSASPGTEPRKASAPSFGASTATPKDVAADSSWAWVTLSRAAMNAVLHECAKASRRVTEPSESLGYPSAS